MGRLPGCFTLRYAMRDGRIGGGPGGTSAFVGVGRVGAWAFDYGALSAVFRALLRGWVVATIVAYGALGAVFRALLWGRVFTAVILIALHFAAVPSFRVFLCFGFGPVMAGDERGDLVLGWVGAAASAVGETGSGISGGASETGLRVRCWRPWPPA